MGKPWNNESAEKWWACGRHVRQKEGARSEREGAPHDAKKVSPPYTVHLSLGVRGPLIARNALCAPCSAASRRSVCTYLTRVTRRRGAHTRRHTHKWDGLHTRHLLASTHTNTHKHKQTHSPRYTTDGLRRSRPWQPQHRRKSHHRKSTRPTAGGRSPPSRSTRSCRIARGDAPPPRPPPVRLELARQSCPSASPSTSHPRAAAVELGLGRLTRCRLHHTAVRACAAGRYVATA